VTFGGEQRQYLGARHGCLLAYQPESVMVVPHALRGGGTVYKPFFGSSRVLHVPLRRLAGPLYSIYERRLTRTLRRGPVPHHLAVIMDGNRRFAARLGLAAHIGHTRGRNKLE